jgi:hypothetical protein
MQSTTQETSHRNLVVARRESGIRFGRAVLQSSFLNDGAGEDLKRDRRQRAPTTPPTHHHRISLHLPSPSAPLPPLLSFTHTPPSPSTRPIPPCFPVSRPGPPPRPELSGSPRSPGAMSPPTPPAPTLTRARSPPYVRRRKRTIILAWHAPPEDSPEI